MRKLYPLLTGLLIFLVTMKTFAQQPSSNYYLSEDIAISDVSNSFIDGNDKNGQGIFSGNEASAEFADSCKADFEIIQTPNSPFYKYFTALTWNSAQKRPLQICWIFGDGTDTCIQYPNLTSAPFSIVHH